MEYIYSRVSTGKQDTANQLDQLKAQYPNAMVYEEIASGTRRRPVLEELFNIMGKGDILIVAALDRLGRRTSEILALIEVLEKRGVILKSAREGMDYSTIAGKLVTQILVACAEMERGLISERTKQALKAKRKLGIVGGRRATYAPQLVAEAKAMRASGKSYREIASATGISLSRVWQLCR